jgi:hypothetical protein
MWTWYFLWAVILASPCFQFYKICCLSDSIANYELNPRLLELACLGDGRQDPLPRIMYSWACCWFIILSPLFRLNHPPCGKHHHFMSKQLQKRVFDVFVPGDDILSSCLFMKSCCLISTPADSQTRCSLFFAKFEISKLLSFSVLLLFYGQPDQLYAWKVTHRRTHLPIEKSPSEIFWKHMMVRQNCMFTDVHFIFFGHWNLFEWLIKWFLSKVDSNHIDT